MLIIMCTMIFFHKAGCLLCTPNLNSKSNHICVYDPILIHSSIGEDTRV